MINTMKQIFTGLVMFFVLTIGTTITDNKEIFTAVSTLIIIDTITGIASAIKKSKKVTSWRMFIGIFLKVFFLMCILISGALLQKVISFNFIGYAALVLCAIEVYSIDENLESLTGFSLIKKIKIVYNNNKEFIDKLKNQ